MPHRRGICLTRKSLLVRAPYHHHHHSLYLTLPTRSRTVPVDNVDPPDPGRGGIGIRQPLTPTSPAAMISGMPKAITGEAAQDLLAVVLAATAGEKMCWDVVACDPASHRRTYRAAVDTMTFEISEEPFDKLLLDEVGTDAPAVEVAGGSAQHRQLLEFIGVQDEDRLAVVAKATVLVGAL